MSDEQIIKALECSPLDDIWECRKIDALEFINRQKAEIERLQQKYELSEAEREANVKGFAESLATVKSEAIKEFAERLKEKSKMPLGTLYGKLVYLTDIDNLVKEMTEDEENEKNTDII